LPYRVAVIASDDNLVVTPGEPEDGRQPGGASSMRMDADLRAVARAYASRAQDYANQFGDDLVANQFDRTILGDAVGRARFGSVTAFGRDALSHEHQVE
jgi:hypothetical protein